KIIDAYTYNPAPQLDGVQPSGGPSTGQQPVVLFGLNLGNGSDITSVMLANVSAVIVSQSASVISVLSGPSASLGSGDVVVMSETYGTVTMVNGYTYYQPGLLVEVSPKSGPQGGGQYVTMSGVDIGNGTDIT